jgi:putative ABC transport system substrate-binding protein
MRSSLITLIVVALIFVAGVFFIAGDIRSVLPTSSGKDVYHIGILVRGSGYEPAVQGYKDRMTQLGYVEGKNITYDVQFISAQDQLAPTVKKFIAEGVDLIHTYSTPATEAAYAETKNMAHPTPIVFGSMGDPLLSSAVEDIQRPGHNVTGVASLSTDLTAKRLELLKEINPLIKRVAFPRTAEGAGDLAANKSVDIALKAAKDLGIELILYPVKSKDDNARVAAGITKDGADGMTVGGDSLVWGSIDLYIAQAIKEKIPFTVFSVSQVQQGGLAGIGPDFAVSGRQSADMSHKILRGGNPANIPIQAPEKLIFVVNKATAAKIGLTLTPEFLSQADVVIDK